ncbi:PRC-barrel domain-containing protein [Trujillonella humicola]|uniref:PRC-barrel domain-containing protein n=1 Tax=Trujillonella humicola TaxID=3383699 RepID=UPI003905865A
MTGGDEDRTAPPTGRMVQLRDTDRTVADADSDVRGRRAVDARGEAIGEVDDLLVDDAEGRVRFLQVGTGGLLGLGRQSVLVPVEAVVAIDAETVTITRDREAMAAAPAYDPELAEDPAYYATVYGWWSPTPYWTPGPGPTPHVR